MQRQRPPALKASSLFTLPPDSAHLGYPGMRSVTPEPNRRNGCTRLSFWALYCLKGSLCSASFHAKVLLQAALCAQNCLLSPRKCSFPRGQADDRGAVLRRPESTALCSERGSVK